ncbi:MAG: D-alanine--D-alanine ligase [Gammaproteobacteria bacterium]
MSKTVLLAGGDSPEREVSLTGGSMIFLALQRLQIPVESFDPFKRPLAEITTLGASRAFNILHGGYGENGELQGALKMLGMPCTGSGVLASALAMDKHRAKLVWKAAGISTPRWRIVGEDGDCEAASELRAPLFVKPNSGGSSTRAGIVRDPAQLPDAVAFAGAEGYPVLVEEFANGREYTMGVLDDAPLPLIDISVAGEFYDYHAKYVAEDTRFACPCGLPAAEERRLQDACMEAFSLLGCRHWGRVDFILTKEGPLFLEVNTVPGMTSHSLVPHAAEVAGVDYDSLVRRILESAS